MCSAAQPPSQHKLAVSSASDNVQRHLGCLQHAPVHRDNSKATARPAASAAPHTALRSGLPAAPNGPGCKQCITADQRSTGICRLHATHQPLPRHLRQKAPAPAVANSFFVLSTGATAPMGICPTQDNPTGAPAAGVQLRSCHSSVAVQDTFTTSRKPPSSLPARCWSHKAWRP